MRIEIHLFTLMLIRIPDPAYKNNPDPDPQPCWRYILICWEFLLSAVESCGSILTDPGSEFKLPKPRKSPSPTEKKSLHFLLICSIFLEISWIPQTVSNPNWSKHRNSSRSWFSISVPVLPVRDCKDMIGYDLEFVLVNNDAESGYRYAKKFLMALLSLVQVSNDLLCCSWQIRKFSVDCPCLLPLPLPAPGVLPAPGRLPLPAPGRQCGGGHGGGRGGHLL